MRFTSTFEAVGIPLVSSVLTTWRAYQCYVSYNMDEALAEINQEPYYSLEHNLALLFLNIITTGYALSCAREYFSEQIVEI